MEGVFLGLPNTGNIRIELMMWVMNSMQSGMRHIAPIQAKPHDHARNLIVKNFLQTDCTFLLMIDSDVVPLTPVNQMCLNDLPVCSAHVSTCKGNEVIPVGMTKDEKGYHHNFKNSNPEGAPHRVDAVGTGCIMIRRDVFDTLDKPFFRFVYDEEGLLINGEDFNFSERVGEVYFDPRHKAQHFTTIAI
jgi:hypothetical protein